MQVHSEQVDYVLLTKTTSTILLFQLDGILVARTTKIRCLGKYLRASDATKTGGSLHCEALCSGVLQPNMPVVHEVNSPPTRAGFKKHGRKLGAKVFLIFTQICSLFGMKMLFYDQDWSILPKCNLSSNGLSIHQKVQTKPTKPNHNKITHVLLWSSCLLSFLWLRSFIPSPLIHHLFSPLFSSIILEQGKDHTVID